MMRYAVQKNGSVKMFGTRYQEFLQSPKKRYRVAENKTV